MSNMTYPVALSSVVDPVADFDTKPSFLVQKTAVQPVYFSNVQLNNYSDSLLNFKLQVSNAGMLIDRVSIIECPIQFNITGSRSDGANLLQDGQFGVRNFMKCVNIASLTLGATATVSVNSNQGILYSQLEQTAPMSEEKYFQSLDTQVYDNCSNYDDMVGSLRNVLSLYRNGCGSYIGSATYDIEILSNTPASASLLINFKFSLLLSPLLTEISAKSQPVSLSHNDSLIVNLQLQNLNTRLLRFSRDALGSRLSITNIQPVIGPNTGVKPPVAYWSTYSVVKDIVPPVVNYNAVLSDMYQIPISLTPADGFQKFSGMAITLNTIPSYVLISVGHPMSNYNSQNLQLLDGSFVHGSQLTDTFCAINNVEIQANGQNQQNQSTAMTLWKQSVQNGCQTPYYSWSGTPLIQTSDPVSYTYGCGSVVKLNFDTDLKISFGDVVLSPGTAFRFLFQANVTCRNIYKLTNGNLSLYYTFVYPSLITSSGTNQNVLQQSPLTPEDCINAQRVETTTHYNQVVDHSLYGFGIHGKLSKYITNHRAQRRTKRARMLRQHLKGFRENTAEPVPEMSALGSGMSAGKRRKSRKAKGMSAGGMSAGRRRKSRKMSVRF